MEGTARNIQFYGRWERHFLGHQEEFWWGLIHGGRVCAQNHHLRGIYKRSGQIRGSAGRNLCSSPFNRSLKLRHVLPQLLFWKLQHGIPQKSLSYPSHLLQCPLLYKCELWRCPLLAQQLSRPYLPPGQLPRDLQRPNRLPASLWAQQPWNFLLPFHCLLCAQTLPRD